MDAVNRDELLRAYATLTSLRSQLPDRYIKERWSMEYNQALIRVGDALGIDLSEFEVPDEYLSWEISSISGSGRVTHRGDQRKVDVQLFRAKFDAVLNYLKLLMPAEDARRMGF